LKEKEINEFKVALNKKEKVVADLIGDIDAERRDKEDLKV